MDIIERIKFGLAAVDDHGLIDPLIVAARDLVKSAENKSLSDVVLNRLADYGITIDQEIADSVVEAVLQHE